MKIKNKKKTIIIASVVVATAILMFVAGCSVEWDWQRKAPSIPDTTKVIEGATAGLITSIADDKSSVTFSSEDATIKSLAPGDVIISGATPLTPRGMIRRVTGKNEESGHIIVYTEPARLEDAIENGSFEYETILEQDEIIEKKALREGVSFSTESKSRFDIESNLVINFDTAIMRGVTLTGNVCFNPKLHASVKIKNFLLTDADVHVAFKERVQVGVELGCYGNIDKEFKIASIKYGPYTVMIGCVPVVMSPEITIKAGIDGEISAGVSTSVYQQSVLQLGAVYRNGKWKPNNSYSNEFGFSPPTLEASLDAKAWAGPSISIWIYDTFAPWFEPHVYLELDADISRKPWWCLYLGFDVSIGIDYFNWLIYDEDELVSFKVVDFKKELACASVDDLPPTTTTTTTTTTSVAAVTTTTTTSVTATPTPVPDIKLTIIYWSNSDCTQGGHRVIRNPDPPVSISTSQWYCYPNNCNETTEYFDHWEIKPPGSVVLESQGRQTKIIKVNASATITAKYF
ncbi:MAG: hypothetical protein JW881_14905 [Spirochaetales bacterium]|nr:hypothetical protein [Spirochaetales bacterium]